MTFTIQAGSRSVVSSFNPNNEAWISRLIVNNGTEAEDCILTKHHATERGARAWASKVLATAVGG